MSTVKHVTAGDTEYPFKFTKRATAAFEEKSGVRMAEFESKMLIKHLAMLCLEALRVGHRLEDKPFRMTQEELLDLDDKYDIIDAMMDQFGEDEKKLVAS